MEANAAVRPSDCAAEVVLLSGTFATFTVVWNQTQFFNKGWNFSLATAGRWGWMSHCGQHVATGDVGGCNGAGQCRRPPTGALSSPQHTGWVPGGVEVPGWHQTCRCVDWPCLLICALTDVPAEPCWYCLRSLDTQYRPKALRQVSTTLPKHIITPILSGRTQHKE